MAQGLYFENAVTSNPPIIGATGPSTNIGLQLAGKGTGPVYVASNFAFTQNSIASVVAGTGAACVSPDFCHNNAGRVNVGATPGTTVTINFNASNPFIGAAPACTVLDETSFIQGLVGSVITTAVAFLFNGTLNGGDIISYQCTGLQ